MKITHQLLPGYGKYGTEQRLDFIRGNLRGARLVADGVTRSVAVGVTAVTLKDIAILLVTTGTTITIRLLGLVDCNSSNVARVKIITPPDLGLCISRALSKQVKERSKVEVATESRHKKKNEKKRTAKKEGRDRKKGKGKGRCKGKDTALSTIQTI